MSSSRSRALDETVVGRRSAWCVNSVRVIREPVEIDFSIDIAAMSAAHGM